MAEVGALDLIRAAQWLSLPAIEKAVLIAMITNPRVSHKTWLGNPSAEALAAASGWKVRRVREARKTLAAHRVISCVGNEAGGASASEWRIEAHRIMSLAAIVRDDSVCGVHGLQGCTTCRGAPRAGVHHVHPLRSDGVIDTEVDHNNQIGAGAPRAGVHHVQGSGEKLTPEQQEQQATIKALDAAWEEELQASPKALHPRTAGRRGGWGLGLAKLWPMDLVAEGQEYALTVFRGWWELCRGTDAYKPAPFNWGQFSRKPEWWQAVYAWKTSGASEPFLGRERAPRNETAQKGAQTHRISFDDDDDPLGLEAFMQMQDAKKREDKGDEWPQR